MKYYEESCVKGFFRLLNDNGINYILLKNIGNELPKKLLMDKDIDVVIHPNDYKRYVNVMHFNDYVELMYPYGEDTGWSFLYWLNKDDCIMMQHRKNRLLIDSSDFLMTKSIGRNAWVPFNRDFQESIWQKRIWNREQGWWQMDEDNLFVYLIVRSVFEKKEFTPTYIMEIDSRKKSLRDDKNKVNLKKFFFKFTEELVALIESSRYDEIYDSYLTFQDY